MRLSDRQFNLLALTALLALAVHLPRLPLWFSVALLPIAPLRMWTRARTGRRLSAWIRVPLVLLLIAVVILHYGNLFGREPGSALACGLLMLKLLESERTRDARAATAFAAFVLMSALLITQSMGFTLLVCSCTVLLLTTLNALQPAPVDPPHRLRGELRASLLLVALGLPLAAAAFLFIPRLGSPLWGSPGGGFEARTGLDDHMSPGSLTELLVDESPAFRVQFDSGAPPAALRYFRAVVMTNFDGTTWTRTAPGRSAALEAVVAQAKPIDYEITLESNYRPWLVALDVPLSAPAELRLRGDRTLVVRRQGSELRQYRAQSILAYRLAPELGSRERQRALRLPAGFNPKTLQLGRQWRGETADANEVVRRAMSLFNERFTYTLSPPLLGRDSVDDFLFDTRAGFCEHYSSAFVVLMRAAGIPARVVTGYQGGWWSDLGDYLLVRQSDAHAWSEVWLDDRGWVRVDPTAAVDPARIESSAGASSGTAGWSPGDWWLALSNRIDIVNRLWTQSIVQFNALRQKSLLLPIGISKADQRDLLLALATLFGVILIAASLWVMRSGPANDGDALDRAWKRLCRSLASTGITIRTQEGPLDFLARSRPSIADPAARTAFAGLVDEYVRLRYALDRPAPADVQAFARKVREFRTRRAVSMIRRPV